MGSLFLQIFLVGSVNDFLHECVSSVQGHPRSLIFVQIEILLVRHSNLGPILHRFRDIAGFCSHLMTRPYSTLILGCSR